MKSLAFLVVVAAVLVFHSNARAGPYSLEIIAQAGDMIDGRTIAWFSSEALDLSISNSGEVAFFAKVTSPQGSRLGLMTQRRFIAGAGAVIDGHETGFSSEESLAMNNRGDVAYRANVPGTSGLFVNQTLLLQGGDVIDGQRIALILGSPAINDAGTVVFRATNDMFVGGSHIFSQSEFIAESGLMVDGFTAHNFSTPKINNAGDVAFLGKLEELPIQMNQAVLTPDRVILKPGDSIEDLTIEAITTLNALTDQGDVLMTMKSRQMDGQLLQFIGTQDRILFRNGEIVAGHHVLRSAGPGVLNNQGQFAFLGAVDAPGRIGWFRDRRVILFVDGAVVISEGDILDDKVIRTLHPLFDMNDRGDLAIRVKFEDLSQAVVLATPIPEPSSLVLAMLGICGLLARPRGRSSLRRPDQPQEAVR